MSSTESQRFYTLYFALFALGRLVASLLPDEPEALGLAALMVVLYHARAIFWIGTHQTIATYGWHSWRPDILLSYASIIFSEGWLGVPIFFVLSGYCIHRNAAMKFGRGEDVTLSVRRFYSPRFPIRLSRSRP